MYSEYFGLKELPFSIAPDPRYLFMSDQHREALAHLLYGIKTDGGFVLLTGEVGTGKTTVCRCLLEQIPGNTDIAFILNPKVTVEELLASLCDELGIKYPPGNTSVKIFVDKINEHLLDAHARGRKTVLIIEESQNLGIDVLEQIRLLTNLETNERKLLQIIMLGQPEFRDMLARPELRQLSQRITARYHLEPLSRKEISQYINHRLSVAGLHSQLFSSSITDRIYSLSEGIPRQINLICDRALLGAYAQGKHKVDKSTVNKAASEVLGKERAGHEKKKTPVWVAASLFVIICGAAIAATYYNNEIRNAAVSPPGLTGQEFSGEVKDVEVPADVLKQDPAVKDIIKTAVPDTLAPPPGLAPEMSGQMAFKTLFEKWAITYRPDAGDACLQAREYGFFCLNEKGSLRDLLHLNRPAVLKLIDGRGSEIYAVILSLSEDTATFAIGNETRHVNLDEIALKWSGEYTLIWKTPVKNQAYIFPGSRGDGVKWLDSRLAAINGRSTRGDDNPLFDNELSSEVKQFQLNAGLVPDGIVGPQTIIHINTLTGENMPLLTEAKEKI